MTFLTIFLIALFISLLFAPGYRSGTFFPLLLFFFVLFLGGIAGTYWITPFGPVIWGVSWLPILFVMLLLLFLLSASSPYDKGYRSKNEVKAIQAPPSSALGIFVWLLLLMLLIAVVVGFFYEPSYMKKNMIRPIPEQKFYPK